VRCLRESAVLHDVEFYVTGCTRRFAKDKRTYRQALATRTSTSDAAAQTVDYRRLTSNRPLKLALFACTPSERLEVLRHPWIGRLHAFGTRREYLGRKRVYRRSFVMTRSRRTSRHAEVDERRALDEFVEFSHEIRGDFQDRNFVVAMQLFL
jgi:hypothetical protein